MATMNFTTEPMHKQALRVAKRNKEGHNPSKDSQKELRYLGIEPRAHRWQR